MKRLVGNLRIWPGPILAVELVTSSRRTRYFVLRVIYAAALLFALWATHHDTIGSSAGDINSIARFAAAFFATFGVMQLMAVLLIGPALAAGTIAQERERRTMEYLYATPLSNLEIVIGKLGGRVLQILGLVLSGVPVLALAMLLGGIAPRAIVGLTAITLSTVLFVTMVSLAVSAWTAKARDAVIRAYLVFFCLWVLPLPLFSSGFPSGFVWLKPVIGQFVVANPVMTFVMFLDGRGPWGPVAEPWTLLLALVRNQMLVGGMALLLATLFMRRIHLREAGKPARKRRWRMQFFRGEIGANPMFWKELYAEPGASRLGLLGYGLLVLIFLAVCGFTLYTFNETAGQGWRRDTESFCAYVTFMSTLLSCGGLLLLTARAAGSITSEKERDCWVSLISTPLEAGEIVKAKILGSLWSLRGLVPFLAVVWLPALMLRPFYFWGIVFALLGLAILAAFTATLGVYCSLSSKNTLRAMGAALGITIFLGGGYLLCCCPVAMAGSPGPRDGFEIGLVPCMPFLLAWPGAASIMLDPSTPRGMEREFGAFMAAYLVGTIGYAVAAVLMLVATIGNFDEKSGRLQRRSGYSQRPRLRSEEESQSQPPPLGHGLSVETP